MHREQPGHSSAPRQQPVLPGFFGNLAISEKNHLQFGYAVKPEFGYKLATLSPKILCFSRIFLMEKVNIFKFRYRKVVDF